MNEWQKNELARAENMAGQLSQFYPARVELQNENYIVVLERDGKQYQVRKDYRGVWDVWRHPSVRYENTAKYSEIRKKHATNKMRVLNMRALTKKLDAEDAIYNELQEADKAGARKHAEFLAEVAATGLPVQYTKNRDGVTTGGTIEKNGLEFSFSLDKDGYISKKIMVHWRVNNTLESFIGLSTNNYAGRD